MVRIGIFNPTLSNIGGAEYLTIVLINALKERGHQVILMSGKKIESARTKFFFGKTLDVDMYVSPLFESWKWMPFSGRLNDCVAAIQSYILKLNCEILIDAYSSFIFPWSDITYFQERTSKIPPSISSLFYIPLFKQSITRKKIALAVSNFLADFYIKRGVPCTVLYPPVNVRYLNPSGKDLCKSRKDVVITLSRFSPEKKLERIPEIAKYTRKNISFIIAGSCHTSCEYKVLETLVKLIKKLQVKDKIRLLPNRSREEVRKLLLNSKVYLHTRENEPFGITIVESMASGCIPTVHDSGGPREIVPEDLRYTTTEEAVEIIEEAVSRWSLEKSIQMSEMARRFDEKNFSKDFLELLDKCMENKFA